MLGGFLKTCKNATSSTIVILIWPKNCLKIKCYCDKPPLWWSVCFFRVIYPFTAPAWLWIVLPVGQFKLYLQFNFQIRDLSFIRGGGGGGGLVQFFFPRWILLCPPPISCRKNVTLPLVWPKIVMTLPTLKDMTRIIKRDWLLPCDERRRQNDIQEQVSTITSRIDTNYIKHEQSWCCWKILNDGLCSFPSWSVNTEGKHYEAQWVTREDIRYG